ncbi:MAG TPA: class I SAM-dependent methyltransferase [Bryobacteraceae bacterium]|nr:class I SAM-dependent methyltransferase [Bryobacteraceae bacterium]
MTACLVCGHAAFRPLCNATDRLYGTTQTEFQIVACESCGLMRLAPLPAPEDLSRYYPANYWYTPDGSLVAAMEQRYRRLVLRDHVRFVSRALAECGESGPTLDVGCGGGLFPRMLRESGCRAMGLDSSAKAAAVAWRANGVPVLCGDLEQAPFPGAAFRAITMFHVLEHLYDPRAYLAAAHALLKPSGRLIVQVPNAACWQFRLLGSRWNGVDAPRHLTDFRARDLEALLAAAGFEVLRRKYFSLRDNPAGLATSLAPRLDPMARRVRGLRETPRVKLAKDLAHFALLAAAIPFTLLEAACHAGSTVMIEARKRP